MPARSLVARRIGGLSIFAKLLILIVSLVVGVAALLVSVLISRQVSEMHAELDTKALTYGRLTGKQVESAVAFNDRETAREVFESVAQDRDVESLTLFTSKGAVLHGYGALSSSLPPRLTRVAQSTPFVLPGKTGVAVPVVSLEGPRGTLVVELSTGRHFESRGQVLQRAALAGGLAALIGALGAFLIARSLARRLGAIATVADAVAAGDLAQRPVPDSSRDELGVLARAFNAMLGQLQALIAQIRQSAHDEQARLEGLVEARTTELAGRNADMRRVLDNVGQGFLTLDRDGRISRERSAILEAWFGPAPESGLFAEYLTVTDRATAEWFAVYWQCVLDDLMPLEVNLGQLPRHLSHKGRHFELEYRPVLTEAGALDRVVVVISDVTAALEAARAGADEREATHMFTRVIADRAGFLEFFTEACALVESIREGHHESVALARSLHTLKGNAGLYGLESVATLCHSLEDRLAENGALTDADRAPLLQRWTQLSSKFQTLLGDKRRRVELEDSEYDEILEAVESGASRARLRDMISAWRLEPTQTRLLRIAEQAEALALRLGKGPLAVEIQSNELRLSAESWGPFWAAAIHVIRNALDHGLEEPDARELIGKTPGGRLILRTRLRGDALVIEFSDDGRGIDWDAVKEKATALDLPVRSRADLVQALFADGVSTRDTVTDISGRGIGLAAARRACRDLGGEVEVESLEGAGTTIRFVWPTKFLSTALARPLSPSSPPSGGLERAS